MYRFKIIREKDNFETIFEYISKSNEPEEFERNDIFGIDDSLNFGMYRIDQRTLAIMDKAGGEAPGAPTCVRL